MESTWLRILSETYHLGELFTIQLHPERIELCAKALSGILSEARALVPAVWLARMDEVAAWWRARAAAVVEIRSRTWYLAAIRRWTARYDDSDARGGGIGTSSTMG